MPTGRKIVETAVRMSLADLSVIMSAFRAGADQPPVLVTAPGSDNDRLWGLMAEKGWLTRHEAAVAHLPMAMAAYAIVPEHGYNVETVAVFCFEGLRQNMTAEEIIAVGDGAFDERLAHLFRPAGQGQASGS
ncbi:MAG: hypothetical protein ABWX67_10915 [Allosphingosinicella sp.]